MNATPTTTPSARALLVEWANQQEHWVRAVVSEVLTSRRGLTNDALDAAYEAFLLEKQLREGTAKPVPRLSVGDDGESAVEAFRLLMLRDVKNVNRLADGQTIEFNPRLTVLYGENATGKTGYVRILKRLAAVRGAEPILGNVHHPAATVSREAHITYKLGEHEETHTWHDGDGVAPFTRMHVFDARAVTLHLSKDLAYLFTPGDLALFRHANDAIEGVRSRIDKAISEAAQASNPFVPLFEKGTPVYPRIEALGASTNLAELEALAQVPADEEKSRDALEQRVDALRPQAITSRLHVARSDRELYARILAIGTALHVFDWPAYNKAVEDVTAAAEHYKDATERAFAGVEIPGGLQEAWRAFIHAGERHIHEIGRGDSYPDESDVCIYCHQVLGPAALALIQKYRDYCNHAFKGELDRVTAAVRELAQPVTSLSIAPLEGQITSRLSAIEEGPPPPETLTRARNLVRLGLALVEKVRAGLLTEPSSIVEDAAATSRVASAAITEADALIADLSAKAAERQEKFTAATAELAALKARIQLRDHLPRIREYVQTAQWRDRASTVASRTFRSLLLALTNTSKRASEELLNQNFEHRFAEECVALHAPKVTVSFPGKRGGPERRKVISDHALAEILSEGEQKSIALADFLAEATLRTASSPMIFDDPVTSLDYKRLDYVVDRIAQLSETHQAIVFTHNIWFTTQLLAKFEHNTAACTYYNVADRDARSGVLERGSHPRWDAVGKTAGSITQVIQQARPATGETRAALIERAYSLIRNWCETVVETELLGGVTQRYQAHVAMTQLEKIKPDRLQAAISAVLPIFKKACRMSEAHSQPLETLGVRPTLEELTADWRTLQDARTAYGK